MVEGIFKLHNSTAGLLLLKDLDTLTRLQELVSDKKFKGAKVRLRESMKTQPVAKFQTIEALCAPRAMHVSEATEEEKAEQWKIDLKDKLVPFHVFAYEEQISKKAEFLKSTMHKYVQ